MQAIGCFVLANNGGFVCQGKVQYIDNDGNMNLTDGYGNMPIGQRETMNPGDKGVPDGAPMRMYIDIVAGDDRTGSPWWLFSASSNQCANYDITGTTLNSSVHFNGITTGC